LFACVQLQNAFRDSSHIFAATSREEDDSHEDNLSVSTRVATIISESEFHATRVYLAVGVMIMRHARFRQQRKNIAELSSAFFRQKTIYFMVLGYEVASAEMRPEMVKLNGKSDTRARNRGRGKPGNFLPKRVSC